MKPTIYLDMDGVLTDFVGAVAKLFKYDGDIYLDWRRLLVENKVDDPYKIEGVLGITTNELWSTIDGTGMSFWSQMEYYPQAASLYTMLQGYGDVVILSSPAMDPSSWSGKVVSLQQFFNRDFRDFILCPAPHKVKLANKNSILIDDAEKNIDTFTDAGGQGILFPQPWNSAPGVANKIKQVELELELCLYGHLHFQQKG